MMSTKMSRMGNHDGRWHPMSTAVELSSVEAAAICCRKYCLF